MTVYWQTTGLLHLARSTQIPPNLKRRRKPWTHEKQDTQSTYTNITLRRVRATTVAVEKQHSTCV